MMAKIFSQEDSLLLREALAARFVAGPAGENFEFSPLTDHKNLLNRTLNLIIIN